MAYAGAYLLAPPPARTRAFDVVVEVFALQVLAGGARRTAFDNARPVAAGGRLLVIAGARDEQEHPGRMPGPLLAPNSIRFRGHGLCDESIEDFIDHEPGLSASGFR